MHASLEVECHKPSSPVVGEGAVGYCFIIFFNKVAIGIDLSGFVG